MLQQRWHALMHCSQCQAENPAGQKFCGECGAKLPAGCPACGHANPPQQKFCGECGASLASGPAPTASKFASPQQYTPKHLAEKILTSRSALTGERKQVTILFVDAVGSTAIAQKLDPEEMHQILDRAFELMLQSALKKPDGVRDAHQKAREIVERTSAGLRNETLRASFERSPLIRQVYDLADATRE